ncbi:hypothetical protein [Streptomyces cavernae]|uniref:hypothetical protein n=1 Tax=Streptomyces cavernae TaxID=2259034 RepID=UPI00192E6A94|nr:hypothetical protein [Streptomyces cavernae]
MTVPEENRPKTGTTDEVLQEPGSGTDQKPQSQGASGRTLREALEEAHLHPDDFEEK